MKKTRRSYNSTLPPSKGPTRKTRLKVKGRERFKGRKNEAFREWVRDQGCVVRLFCMGAVACHHLKTRAAGGTDVGNCVGLCVRHHDQWHTWGRHTFDARHDIDLKEQAETLGRRWREQQGETAA